MRGGEKSQERGPDLGVWFRLFVRGGGQNWKNQESGRARPYPGKNEPGCRGRTHPGWALRPLGLGTAGMGWLLWAG